MPGSQWSLVGDIGGTHARFALVREGSLELHAPHTLENADFSTLDAAVSCYLARHAEGPVTQACLALACPVESDFIRFTNARWQFSREDMARCLGLERLQLINDFTAMALGVPAVPASGLVGLGGLAARPGRPLLVMGPGTGLGVSALIPLQDHWLPLATEGGHVDLVAGDTRELAVLAALQERFGRVSAERALSGGGIENLYQVCCHLAGVADAAVLKAADITLAARQGTDPQAVEALELFFALLGRACGNAALTLGALGGVYLCGGILPRLVTEIQNSRFRSCFEDKGRMRSYLQPVPVWLVTDGQTGLLGAAAALGNPLLQPGSAPLA